MDLYLPVRAGAPPLSDRDDVPFVVYLTITEPKNFDISLSTPLITP